jgi:hypothetical protein
MIKKRIIMISKVYCLLFLAQMEGKSPQFQKLIFSKQKKATRGSSFYGIGKIVFEARTCSVQLELLL